MKKILLASLIGFSVMGCSSGEEAPVVAEEGVAPELMTQLTAAQELENDIEKLNREIDSLLNAL